MELELKKQEWEFCRRTQPIVVSHEESMEAAIPEYCPDMARIVESVGQLKLREKKLSGGRLTVAGTVKVTVLYTSEESAGLRSLVLSVPFTCQIEDERLRRCRSVCAGGRLQLVEARAVTARKLYVRVMPEFEVEGIQGQQCSLCCGVGEEPSLQTRREERTVQVLGTVLERTFHFDQECFPEPGRGVPEDLLLDRVALRITGCQRMGHKLIVKGEATAALLYRTEGQDLSCCEAVLVFSQILDGGALPEEAAYQAEVWCEDSDVRLVRTAEGMGFGVSLKIGVLVKVYEQRSLCALTDLYSTRYEAAVRRETAVVTASRPTQTVHQEVSVPLEFGRGRPFAWVTGVECGAVSAMQEGERTALRSNVRLKLVYLDEAGTPVSTERTVEAQVSVAKAPESARAVCSTAALELGEGRGTVQLGIDFQIEESQTLEVATVGAVELQECREKELPALVLRRCSGGESLWELGKTYRTEPEVIAAANGLEEGATLPGGMVLIPRGRR